MARQLEPRAQLLGLAVTEAGARDLLDLMAEQLEPSLDLAWLQREPGELRSVLPPALDRPLHLGAQALVAAERIEQLPLPALVEEARLLVLAVDLDEAPNGLCEPAGGHGLVVESEGHYDQDEYARQLEHGAPEP